jgi:putative transposase
MELVSGAHIKYQVVYHLQWIPKCRYRIFRKEKYRYDYENILRLVARRHLMEIIELAVMPDHVHVVVSAHPTMSPSKALQLLKGGSSYDFFHLHPEFRLRYLKGHLFAPGKFCRSVGDVDLKTTANYVRNQAQQATLTDFFQK